LLARGFGWVIGEGSLAGGLLAANLAFVAGLGVLYLHLRSRLDLPTARFVVVALSFSPFALYFSVPYTESLYLLLMVSAMHCAHRGHWVWAGLLAAALSATRNLGVFIVVALALMALQEHGCRALCRLAPGTEGVWLGLCLVPLGLFTFMAYLYGHMGDALAFKNVQVAWGGMLGNPLEVVSSAFMTGGFYEQYSAAAASWAWP
jgi:Gpi18-like mannosyltransferase